MRFFEKYCLKNKYMRVFSISDHLAFFSSFGLGSHVGYLICSLLELIDRCGDKNANDMQIDTLGQFFVNRIAAYVHMVPFNNGPSIFVNANPKFPQPTKCSVFFYYFGSKIQGNQIASYESWELQYIDFFIMVYT